MPSIKRRINLGASEKPLQISDIFKHGKPNREERKELKRAFKSLHQKGDNSQQLLSDSRLDESTEPFVSPSTLASSTEYINAAGNALGTAISGIQFTPVTKDTGDFTVSTYGNLNTFHVDINGKKEGKSSLGSAVVNIEKLNNAISGLDALVKDGLSSLTPKDEITGNSQQQTIPYTAYSNSGAAVYDETGFKIEVKAYLPEVFGVKTKVFDVTFSGDFTLSSPYASMDATIDSLINYDSSAKQANLGAYTMSDLSLTPSLSSAWDQYWNYAFGDVSNWWDQKIGKSSNPFTYIQNAVDAQIASGENLLTNQAEKTINAQLNSPSVKPAIDSSFQALYGVAWDRQTYPLSGGWAEG